MAIPSLDVILNGLAVAAGAALLVERFIELLQSLRERANHMLLQQQHEATRMQQIELSLEQANDLHQRVRQATSEDRLSVLESALPSPAQAVTDTHENFERHSAIPCIPLPEYSQQQMRLKAFLALSPVAVGIVVAAFFELHLLAMFRGEAVYPAAELLADGKVGVFFYQMFDTLLSGVLIGGGSQPVHILIKFLTSRQLTVAEQSRREPASANEEERQVTKPQPQMNPEPYQWQPLTYLGGVQPAALEHVHQRRADPDQIVVHHTAMHSQLGFDAIVDEFLKRKKWLTGYHAVIMPDGTIQPFCRWDRTGNHAAGHNHHTLGIAFHGNFHQGTDRFSNHDGRYGNLRPTPEQLEAGARLIALWTFLYPSMREPFMVPHRQLDGAQTVCPGNRFPWQILVDEVNVYRGHWCRQAGVLQAIRRFANRDYLYATARPTLFPEVAQNAQTITTDTDKGD